jgi:O-acetyl-ADP-ribose deacetylase
MRKPAGSGFIELLQDDITRVRIDAIVTAANSGLRGGGGVDGAVHRAAGSKLLEACKTIGGCPTGSAVVTGSFDLAENGVQYVVHAVGPIWRGGTNDETRLLEGAYTSSLRLAEENRCTSIAFPSISTGVYGFPVDQAAYIAVGACRKFLESEPEHITRIVFVLFDDKTYGIFEKMLADS